MTISEQIDSDRKFLEVIVPYGSDFVKAAKNNNWKEAARLQSEALERLTQIVEEARIDELELYKWHNPNNGLMPDFDYMFDRINQLKEGQSL